MPAKTKYNYQKITEDLLKVLPERTADVLRRRFGIEKEEKETLASIGESYKITRERVRQIENVGFAQIRSKVKKLESFPVFKYFREVLNRYGKLKEENSFLNLLAGDEKNIIEKNNILFLLSASTKFQRLPENELFFNIWTIDKARAELVKKFVTNIKEFLKKKGKPVLSEEIFSQYKKEMKVLFGKELKKNIFQSYLEISKEVGRNINDEYGLIEWGEINPKSTRDKAYLVFKKEKKPLHFTKVASLIAQLPSPYQRNIHPSTVHNELIKDERFVLVGRGLYALREWGYEPGLVKDIIIKLLKKSKKPLPKEKIVEAVLAQRFVKKNTILFNLNDANYFERDEQGRYKIKEA